MSDRVYCWRVGSAMLLIDGVCQECGSPNHEKLSQEVCGNFVPCDRNHGHSCPMLSGHEGRCIASCANRRRSFMDRLLCGELTDPQEEMDNAIDVWHQGGTNMSLPEWLGLTTSEYYDLLANKTTLEIISKSRNEC